MRVENFSNKNAYLIGAKKQNENIAFGVYKAKLQPNGIMLKLKETDYLDISKEFDIHKLAEESIAKYRKFFKGEAKDFTPENILPGYKENAAITLTETPNKDGFNAALNHISTVGAFGKTKEAAMSNVIDAASAKALPESLGDRMKREGITIVSSNFQKQPGGRSFLTLVAEKGGRQETQRVPVGYQHKTEIDSPKNLAIYTELGLNNLLTRFSA